MLRKGIAVFLLTLLVFNVMLSYIMFSAWDIRLKYEMAETISRLHSISETIVIRLPAGECKNDDDEIVFEGKLYDIVKKEYRNNMVYFYVINDSKEEELFSNFNGNMHPCFGDCGHHGRLIKLSSLGVTDNFQVHFCDDRSAWVLKPDANTHSGHRFYPRVYYPVPTPPPRCGGNSLV